MSRGIVVLAALSASVLLAGIWRIGFAPAPAVGPRLAEVQGVPEAPPEWRGRFPNVTLITQEGRPVRFYDDLLKGHLVALNFFYIECQGTCPGVTSTLVEVERSLRNRLSRDLRIVSISLQPERDTPEELRAYATRYGAGPGMTFLTGQPGDIELVRRAMGFAHPEDPVRDRDRRRHGALLKLGNEPEGWWSSCPSVTSPGQVIAALRSLDAPRAGRSSGPPLDFPGGVPLELQSTRDLPARQECSTMMERLEQLWMSRIPMEPARYQDLMLSQLAGFLGLPADATDRFRSEVQAALRDLAGARKKMVEFRMEHSYDPEKPDSVRGFRAAWRDDLEARSRAFARLDASLPEGSRTAILREQTARWMGYLEDLPDAPALPQDSLLMPIRKK